MKNPFIVVVPRNVFGEFLPGAVNNYDVVDTRYPKIVVADTTREKAETECSRLNFEFNREACFAANI